MRLRSWLLILHRWLGLALGVWALAAALTGSLLAFRAPLQAALGPGYMLTRPAPTTSVDFDRITRSIRSRYPDRQIIGFYRDGLRADESFQVQLTRSADPRGAVNLQDPGFNTVRDADLDVFVVPQTGAILGERPFWAWMRFVYWLHKELLFPFAGAPYLGVLGLALLFMVVSGLTTWWPRAGQFGRALRIATDRGQGRLLRDLHRSGGAIMAILIGLSAATGAFMCYELRIVSGLTALGLANAEPIRTPSPTNGRPGLSVGRAVDAALAAYPDYQPVVVTLPVAGRGSYAIQLFPRHRSRVWWTVEVQVDAVSGAFLSVFDPAKQRLANSVPLWVIFLHNGQMFGWAGRTVVLIEGLTLTMLCVTGPWTWLLRRRARARARAPA